MLLFFHLINKILQLERRLLYWRRFLHILCDTLQSYIINVIVLEDGGPNHFYFYSPGGRCCQNLRLSSYGQTRVKLTTSWYNCDLWPLNGSRVTRVMGFLLVSFQLPKPFRSRFRVRQGTDSYTSEEKKTEKKL